MINDLRRVCNVEIVPQFNGLFQRLCGRMEENHENLRIGGLCLT
jgi:hypothetical protein